jgi:hypothetical protein
MNQVDKILVILAVSAIAILSIFKMPNPETIVTAVLSGLFGLVSGAAITHTHYKTERKKDDQQGV